MWDDKLQEVVYAYNTAVQESTKHTPFEAMFGRVACLPVDINVATFYDFDTKVKIFQDAQEQGSLNMVQSIKELQKLLKKTSNKHNRNKRNTMT